MKILKLLLLVIMQNSITYADLSHYLKKLTPQDKSGNHSMKEIDFIYTINLDQRPEKFATCTKQLSLYDIHPYRFSAVNGWELSLETINELGIKYNKSMRNNLWGTCYLLDEKGEPHHEIMHVEGRNYFSHCLARGPIGITLSHLSILYDAYTSGYKRIWVMEDDIDVIQNPHLISTLIEKLDALVGKNGWDFLFTDKDTKNDNGHYVPCNAAAARPDFTPIKGERFRHREQVNPDFIKVGARYGGYSMIIQRCGMKKILDFYAERNIFLPYDMEYILPDDIKLYTVTKDIVSTKPGSISDNGAPRYKENK